MREAIGSGNRVEMHTVGNLSGRHKYHKNRVFTLRRRPIVGCCDVFNARERVLLEWPN